MLRAVYAVAVRATKLAGLFLRQRYRAMAYYAKLHTQQAPVDERTVLFEAYRAVKMADSPLAMFKAMIDDPYYEHFTFVWALDDKDNEYRRTFSDRKNVRFCSIHSREYVRALYTAKYLVNNKAWPFYFTKRSEQVSVNTWHATAFKALGKEQGGSIGQFKNTTRNLLHVDYLVMPNRFTSQVMLRSNDVAGIFPGVVLEEGYPRIDLTINTTPQAASALLQRVSGTAPGKRVALYAPTWRGETGDYGDTMDVVVSHVRDLRALIGDEYELVLKVHDLTYKHLASRKDLSGIRYVPDWVDTNEILPGVDVVITDYSSIFFDYLVLDRPIVFFAYDLEDYTAERGLYFEMDEMPGPLCHTAAQVASALDRIDDDAARYAPRREAMRKEFCGAEDGGSSVRVCDAIFKGAKAPSAYRSFDEHKTRLLVAGCDFDHTSQTFEIIGLSRHLDHDAFDLTVLFTGEATPERERLLRMLDPATRVLYSHSYPTLTMGEAWEWEKRKTLSAAQRCAPQQVERWQRYVDAETSRLLGPTHYHVALCFTDAVNDGTYLVAFGEFDRRILWLADAEQDTAKSFPPKVLRRRFDRILTVPAVEQSRCVRRVRELEAKKPAAGGSILKPVDRFVGYDDAVSAMLEEQRLQAKKRLSVVMHRLGDGGCVDDEYALRRELTTLVDERLSRIGREVRAWIVETETERGFDHVQHNLKVLKTFTDEVAPAGSDDSAPGA